MISLSDITPYLGSVRYSVDVAAAYIKHFLDEQRDAEGLNLDPDFQRGHVWSQQNQTRYIEHLLRGGAASRTIIWNCPGYDSHFQGNGDAPSEMVIVDGKQRLTAILKFIDNEVPVFGQNYLKDFDEISRRTILGATGLLRMTMSVHALHFRHELLQLYIEMNEGAIAHAPEEIARVRALHTEALKGRSPA